MIHRKLLIATAIIASVGITACSDMTAPKKLVPGGLPAAAILAPHAVAAADHEGNPEHVTVVATIKGRGTAVMQMPGKFLGETVFSTGVKLLSDGSATGDFICIDVFGNSTGPGQISGQVTSWSTDPDGTIVLNVSGSFFPLLPPDGHPGASVPLSFIVRIQKFGGKGVGHWTLQNKAKTFLACIELLTSGKIVIVYRDDDNSDHDG
jgi:hypothetical protein